MAAFWLDVPAWAGHSFDSSLDNASSDNASLDDLSLDDASLDNRPTDRSGCHHEGGKTPPSAPVSYRCCMVGHDRAIPSNSFSGIAPLLQVAQASVANAAPSSLAHPIPGIVLASSPSPPGLTALRI
jgi:hypothetical protein